MTLTFATLLGLIFIVEFGIGIGSYVMRNEVRSRSPVIRAHVQVLSLQFRHVIEVNMEKGLQNYAKEGYEGVTNTWNIVQHEVRYQSDSSELLHHHLVFQLHCCGVQEYQDWRNTSYARVNNRVPDTCCLSDIVDCGKGVLGMDPKQAPVVINPNGCLTRLVDVIRSNVAVLAGVGIGIAIIQVNIDV